MKRMEKSSYRDSLIGEGESVLGTIPHMLKNVASGAGMPSPTKMAELRLF